MSNVTKRSWKLFALCVSVAVAFVALDLGTKQWAQSRLSTPRGQADRQAICQPSASGVILPQRIPSDRIDIIRDYLDFDYAENCGAAFGLLRDAPVWLRKSVFGTAAVLAVIMLLYWFRQGANGKLFAFAVPMIVAGAIGNLYDRFIAGYVVDFIHFHIRDTWHYPTFNVADIYITIGIALIILEGFQKNPKKHPTKPVTKEVREKTSPPSTTPSTTTDESAA